MTDTDNYVWNLLCSTLSMSHSYREQIKKEILGNKPQYTKRTYNNRIKRLNKDLMEMEDRKLDLDKRFYGGELNKKKYNILTDVIKDKEDVIIKEIEKNRFQLQSLDQKGKWIDWLSVHFSKIEELNNVEDYETRRSWIIKYVHQILVMGYDSETRQHTIIIQFRLPLFNDKFVWILNKNGSHKTDRWGRWKYEITDGEKGMTNPFTHQKLLNRN